MIIDLTLFFNKSLYVKKINYIYPKDTIIYLQQDETLCSNKYLIVGNSSIEIETNTGRTNLQINPDWFMDEIKTKETEKIKEDIELLLYMVGFEKVDLKKFINMPQSTIPYHDSILTYNKYIIIPYLPYLNCIYRVFREYIDTRGILWYQLHLVEGGVERTTRINANKCKVIDQDFIKEEKEKFQLYIKKLEKYTN